jgi:hypothetical protein
MTSWAIIWHNSKTTTMRLVNEKEHVWCYVRHIDWTTSIFNKTWLYYSMGLGDLSSQVLEDPELKGRCGDLCNESFVPSSNTAVKIRWTELAWKGQISAEFHRNENHQTADLNARKFLQSLFLQGERIWNSQFKKRRIGNGRTQATYHTPIAYGVDSQYPISVPLLAKPHKDSYKSIQNFRKSQL